VTLRRSIRLLAVALTCALFGACVPDDGGALIEEEPDAREADHRYVIPAGTADQIRGGARSGSCRPSSSDGR
jgi:hypothetical protein